MPISIIEINNLHFSYDNKDEILKGINLSLDLRPTAIIGQNGAGKTTFVKLLKGLLRPSQGRIMLNGLDTESLSVAQLAKNIGLIFQNPNDQIFKNTVIDEVMFGILQVNKKIPKHLAKSTALDALKMVRLDHLSNLNPYDLSLSDRKLISIASIIAMDTQIIIFDEPTIAQDFTGKLLIQNIIKSLSAQGKLVISILHDMDFVADCFERVVVFSKGTVILDGPTKSVFAQKNLLLDVYLEQPHIMQLAQELKMDDNVLNVDEFINNFKNNNYSGGSKMKKALLIIDYVYDFIADDGNLTCGKPGQALEQNIINLIKTFQQNGDFVIEVSDNHDESDVYNKERTMFPLHCFDQKGCKLYGEVDNAIDKNQNYLKINKNRYSAFYGTALDLKLKERNVNELHLVGVCTDICILHTAIDAYNLGYKIVVHENGVASFNPAGHEYALSHFKNVLGAEVIS